MRIPKNYYDLPIRTLRTAAVEARSIVNDLRDKGIIDEDLESYVYAFVQAVRWIEDCVADVVANSQTRKSAIKTRRGGKGFTSLAPLQPSKQASE